MTRMRYAAAAGVLAVCIGCGGSGEDVPALETQTVTPPQAQATPERVQGCLRAGEAANTFVLTASRVDTQMPAATYELVNPPEGLREHVGRLVEVTGTVVMEQTARAEGAPLPAEDQVKGTAGTPTVQSTTKVEMKRLQVSGVTPVDGDCDDR
ncbi:MAG TPA: hypothetical protein VFZ36_00940 [Vicinamibacterales bacterium]